MIQTKIFADKITSPSDYFNRRKFSQAGVVAASVVATGAAWRFLNPVGKTKFKTRTIECVIKRLGGKRWRALHRLAYPAAICGLIHY